MQVIVFNSLKVNTIAANNPTNSKTIFVNILLKLIILVAAIVELGMLTYQKNHYGIFVSPFVLLGSGLLVGILFLVYFRNKPFPTTIVVSFNWKQVVYAIVSLIGVYVSFTYLNKIILQFPIYNFRTATGSDVIPQIGIMVERFLNGEFPYQLIKDWAFYHELYPTYLPFTWMPFMLPFKMGIDFRLFAYCFLVFVSIAMPIRFIHARTNIIIGIFLASLTYIFLYYFLLYDKQGNFQFTVETLITGYYLLLSFSLFSNSILLRASSLLFCLLSRYALILWLPLYFAIFLWEEKEKVFKLSIVVGLGLFLFYIIPFYLQDASIFAKGFTYHTEAAYNIWYPSSNNPPKHLPDILERGIGFGHYFILYLDGTKLESLTNYRYLHLGLCILTTVILGVFYWWSRQAYASSIYLLGSLKIYLVVFYNFIQIPFEYLYLVPTFISVPILVILFQDHLSISTEQEN